MNTCYLEPNETEDHAEWLAGIVITDVRSMKEDTESFSGLLLNNKINNMDNEMTYLLEITDSEGEEVDVENIDEEFANEPQCEALRKLTNLSTVELQNQAQYLGEEEHLREFLKITLEGTESESSDSDGENNDDYILKSGKDVEKNSFNFMSKAFLQSNTGLSTSVLQKNDVISKQRIVNDHEQEEIDRKNEIFDEPEFVNIIPNFPGFTCQPPKHKLWRVKHLSTNEYINGRITDNILCNEKEITDKKNVIQNLSKKHCLAQKLDEKPVKNYNKLMSFNNITCRMPAQMVRKNSSTEKFHDGIMTRKRTTQFQEIFTIQEDVQMKDANFDAVNLRNNPVTKDLGQLKNDKQIFSHNAHKYKRHSLDIGKSNKVTKGVEFNPATCNMIKNYTMPDEQLNYNDERKHKTKLYRKNGNFSKNKANNNESVFVKLHMNETDTKTLKAYCNKEVQEENGDLNLQPFQNKSQDEIEIYFRAPQSFDKVSMGPCPELNIGNKKQRVSKNVVIRPKGYKRKLSFGTDGSVSDELDHEKETLNDDILFNDCNVNLGLENKGNSMYPLVSLKRCDNNINQNVYNVNQNKSTPQLNDASDLKLNIEVAFQSVFVKLHMNETDSETLTAYYNKEVQEQNGDLNLPPFQKRSQDEVDIYFNDSDKNVSKVVIDNTLNLNDECDYEVGKSLLTNSTEIDNSDYKILSSCALESNILSIPMRSVVDAFCYQNNDIDKDDNINEQEFSRDFYELPIEKSFILRKSLQSSNNSIQSSNCGSKFEVKPSDNPRIRCSIFNQFRENKENLLGSALNLQCSICLENIPKKSILKHMSLHIKDDNFVCNKCSSIFIDSYSLKKHYPICSEQKHRLHISEQTGSVRLQCTICDHCFMKKIDYDQHLDFHLGHVNYMCNICGFTFNSELLLKSHERRHFEDADSPYSCNVCFSDCDSLRGKIQHEKLHTEYYKSFYCVK